MSRNPRPRFQDDVNLVPLAAEDYEPPQDGELQSFSRFGIAEALLTWHFTVLYAELVI